jgi:hypothetical protein
MPVVPLMLIAAIVVSAGLPVVGSAICIVVLIVQIGIMAVRTISYRSLTPEPARPDGRCPIFSIHVATHAEPPRMVEATLRALAAQEFPADRHEVIVIDNNTEDPTLWEPVRDVCDELGPRFRFLHRMGVTGAKAGALNIALSATRPDATHVVTVDADYILEPDFLIAAARALRETGADYVQFPQAYADCDRVAAGVDIELEEYFRTNARMADGAEAVLLTGTLCVISKTALEVAGGWSGRSTTEDAELGVRLCRLGYTGRFIGKVVGRGRLPLSMGDLERQRRRWAGGNLQTLVAHAPAIFFGRDAMGWRRRGALLSQLTAWLNFSLAPALLLLGALLTGQGGRTLPALAAVSLILCLVDIAGRLTWRASRDGTPPAVLAAAIGNRLALAPVSALATAEVLAGRPLRFIVTDKSGGARDRGRDLPLAGLALFATALAALPAAAASGSGLALAGVLILMTPFPASLATGRSLERYREIVISRDEAAAA